MTLIRLNDRGQQSHIGQTKYSLLDGAEEGKAEQKVSGENEHLVLFHFIPYQCREGRGK